MGERRKLPALRFSDFVGTWNQFKLKDCIVSYKGGAPLKPKDFVERSNNEVIPKKAITAGGILNLDVDSPTFCSESFYNSSQSSIIDNSYIVTTLRDLVPSGPNIGYIVKLVQSREYLLAQGVYGLKVCKTNILEDFLIHESNTSRYRRTMQTIMVGSTQVHIRNTDFFNIDLSLPSLPEQQKIAAFLTAVDEKIQQLSKKKTLLEKYKKGVMQQIFSQQVRFKDDNEKDYAEWELISLNEVARVFDGTHMTPVYQEKGIPFYSVEHLTANNFAKTKFISEEVFNKENKRVKLEKGDILMTRIGDIGTSKYIDWDVNASFYVSLALIKTNDCIGGKYLNQFINSSYFQAEVHKRTIHVAFPKKINLGEIGECQVLLPCLQEQTKIANFLSSLDDKIRHVYQQIELTKQYKKGLLQQMFV